MTAITRTGDTIVAARMIGATPTQAEPKQLGWGTGGVAGGPFTAAKTDVAPFTESAETRVACTTSQVTTTYTNDTWQAVGTITSLSTQTIAEVFLSDSSSKPASGTVAAGGVVGSSSATTLNTAANFSPGNNGYIQIRTEVMQVTAGSGTTSLTVVRGANGSTAISTIAASDEVTGGNAPGSTVVTNGNLFVHSSFSGLPLSSGDSLTPTVQVSYN